MSQSRQAKADNYIRRDSPDPKEFLMMPKMERLEDVFEDVSRKA